MLTTGFAETIASRLSDEHAMLAARWFARLRDLLPVDDNAVFPSDSLLDHIPSLILDISAYVRSPETDAIAANPHVVEKARELGSLRHQQQASLHQVLREYQLLGDVLMQFVQTECAELTVKPIPSEVIAVMMRMQKAVSLLLQQTIETFVGLYTQMIAAQSERLEQFTRMAAHEWRQPLGAVRNALFLLRLKDLEAAQRDRTVDLIERNVNRLVDMTTTLERIARFDADTDNAVVQRVEVSVVANEAARQLREIAQAAQVRVRVAEDMPTAKVDVGRLELVLLNLLSNGIKYADPGKPQRTVDVSARVLPTNEFEIAVADNGLGIPTTQLSRIFQRFTRAHTEDAVAAQVSGIGLGLSIVADCVSEMGGRIEVSSEEQQGSVFRVVLPVEDNPT